VGGDSERKRIPTKGEGGGRERTGGGGRRETKISNPLRDVKLSRSGEKTKA